MEISKIYHGGSPPKSTYSLGGSGDRKVLVSGNDTTPGYLNDEISVNGRISKQILNPGADEKLELYTGDQFTLSYNNLNSNIVTGDFLRPGDYQLQDNGEIGYYTDCGFSIYKVSFLLHNFATTTTRTIYFRFREYIADGSKTTVYAAGEGNLIGTVFYNVPNTSSAQRWYLGGFDDVTWTVSSGYSLFVYVYSSDIDDLDGVTMWLHGYKYPV